MKKVLLFLSMTVLLSGISSVTSAQNIAVVDVQAVVAKSAQYNNLVKEEKAQTKELEKWVKNAQADVDKQKTQEGKDKLLKKYNAELAKKKQTFAQSYQKKLEAIDKSITDTISQKAKALGYDMVISKSLVISGGDDITAEVQKVVK